MAKFKAELKAKPSVREARGDAPVVRWANQDEFRQVAAEPVNAVQSVGAWLQQILNGEFKVHEGACDASGSKFGCHFILAPLRVPFSSPSGGEDRPDRILEGIVAEAANFVRLRVSDAKEFSIEKINGEDILVIGSIEETQIREEAISREQLSNGSEPEREAGERSAQPAAKSPEPGREATEPA